MKRKPLALTLIAVFLTCTLTACTSTDDSDGYCTFVTQLMPMPNGNGGTTLMPYQQCIWTKKETK